MVIKKLNGLSIIDTTKGQSNGLASLNEQGKIPSAQLSEPYGTELYLSKTTPLQYFSAWLSSLSDFNVTWTEKTLSSSVAASIVKLVPISEDYILFCDAQNAYIYNIPEEEKTPLFSTVCESVDIAAFNGEYYVCRRAHEDLSTKIAIYRLKNLELETVHAMAILSQNAYRAQLHNINDEWLIWTTPDSVHVWNSANEEILTLEDISVGNDSFVFSNACTTNGSLVYTIINDQIFCCTTDGMQLMTTINLSGGVTYNHSIELIGNNLLIGGKRYYVIVPLNNPDNWYWWNVGSNTDVCLSCVGCFRSFQSGATYLSTRYTTNLQSWNAVERLVSEQVPIKLYSMGKFLFHCSTAFLRLWLNGEFVVIKTDTPITCIGATRDLICAVYNNKVYIGKCPALL